MIEFNLKQESTKSFGAYTTATDMATKALYLPTSQCQLPPVGIYQRPRRSKADILSTSKHGFAGDTSCSNHQVIATLSNRADTSIVTTSGMGSYSFQKSTTDYVNARKLTLPSFEVVGTCYYDDYFNVAFVPIQDVFATLTDNSTQYSGYVYRNRKTVVFSWVPFGKHYALVVTTYNVSTYLPKYPQYSSATVNVNYTYSDIDSLGSVSIHTTANKLVLNASGSLAAIAPIIEYMAMLTRDPTGYAAGKLDLITPVSSGVPVINLSEQTLYDQKALQPQNISAAVHRLSNAGTLAAWNSMTSEPTYDEWADIADSAVDSCKFSNVNSIAYARDLRLVASELGSVLAVMANPSNPKQWASLYLGLRYGTRLTVSDTRHIVHDISNAAERDVSQWKKKFLYVRARRSVDAPSLSVATSSMRTLNYKVYYKPDDSWFTGKLKALLDWNLFPTLTNVWDLIPYSFVLDWFVGINNLCEELDRRAYTELLNVLGCTYSYKDEYLIPVHLSDLGFEDVDCSVTIYHRHHTPAIHQSALRLAAGHSSTINVVDGFSLIIQRGAK